MSVPLPQSIKRLIVQSLGAAGYVIRKEGCPYRDVKRIATIGGCPTIFDVGAHYGETAMRCRRVFDDPLIYSFEPMPTALRILKERFKSEPRVSIQACALCDNIGRATLHVNQKDIRSSILALSGAGEHYFDPNVGEHEVPTTTVDRFCQEHGVDRIDLLKLDVQGAEALVLKGASEMLDQERITAVYLEVWFVNHYEGGSLFMGLHDLLAAKGFELFRLYDTRHDSLSRLIKGDAVFVNRTTARGILAANPTR